MSEQQWADDALSSAMGQIRRPLAVELLGATMKQRTKPVLIAVGGKPAAGKDTFADRFVDGHGFVKTFFSEPLNAVLIELKPHVPVPFWVRIKNLWKLGLRRHTYASLVERLGYTKAKTIPEVRRLLQSMGTDVGRNMLSEDLWVNMARDRIRAHMAAGASVVLTGVRMPNELAMVRELGGYAVYVTRPGVGDNGHAVESRLQGRDFDSVVGNSGSVSSLALKADMFLENIRVGG